MPACSSDTKPKALRTGDKVPSFKGKDMNGNQVSLAAYKGHPVIMRFWSTECKFCRADTPVFNKYYTLFKDKGLKILYINTTQTVEEVRDFIKELNVTFPVIKDEGAIIAQKYNIKMQPITIVLSPEHTMLAAIYGGVSGDELQELVGHYLTAN